MKKKKKENRSDLLNATSQREPLRQEFVCGWKHLDAKRHTSNSTVHHVYCGSLTKIDEIFIK